MPGPSDPPVSSLAGSLLVASPVVAGDAFHRSVVLLLEHEADSGAWGVVVNRPGTTPVDRLLPGWGAVASEPGVLHRGGPVGLDGALALSLAAPGGGAAGLGEASWRPLTGGLGVVDLGGDPDVLAPALGALRVFVGHAGWTPGQLEEEVDAGAWWVVRAEPGDAFCPDPAGLWRSVLRRQRGSLALHSTLPEDARAN